VSGADQHLGRVFGGRYKVLRKLGEGGIGSVYAGLQTNLDQRVAIKVLRREVSANEVTVQRFRNEARIYARINSPYVVKIHDFGQDGEGEPLYLVMEFLPGINLNDLMGERGPLPPELLCTLAGQILEGLIAAHKLGIVHRDLKPANIMIRNAASDKPFAQILDFGLGQVAGTLEVADTMEDRVAQAAGADFHHGLTMPGAITGTPLYMSPEQCKGERLDHRSDIYSLGVILYHMACGHPPFMASTTLGLMTMHATEAAKPLRERFPELETPAALDDIIMRCLEKSPDRRPDTAAALMEELSTAAHEMSSPSIVPLLEAGERYGADAPIPVSRRSFGDSERSEEDTVAIVGQILLKLGKAYKSFAMYPRDNPIFQHAADELHDLLDHFFQESEHLALSIDRFAVHFAGQRVYEDTDVRFSYPFKLFADGIRKLFFHQGITRTEIASYLDCLHKVSSGPRLTSDLVTLMWERRFERITYHLVEDLIEDTMPHAERLGELVAADDYAYRGVAPARRQANGNLSATPTATVEAGLQPMSDEDKTELERLIVLAETRDDTAGFAHSVVGALRQSRDVGEVQALLKVLAEVIRGLLALGDLEHALMLLSPVRRMLTEYPDNAVAGDLRKLLTAAGDEQHVAAVIKRLKDADLDGGRHIGTYLALCEPTVVPSIIDHLDTVEGDALQVLQIALLVLCKKAPARLQPGLEHGRTPVVVATVLILSECEAASAIVVLRPLLKHPAPQVRLEALRALFRHRDTRLARELKPLMDNPDPDVRRGVIDAMGGSDPNITRAPLIALLDDEAFLQREHEEQAALFRSMARLGGADTVSAMGRVLFSAPSEDWIRRRVMRMVGLVIGAVAAALVVGKLGGVFAGAAALAVGAIVIVRQGVEEIANKRGRMAVLVEPAALCLKKIGTAEAMHMLTHAATKGSARTKRVCERMLQRGDAT